MRWPAPTSGDAGPLRARLERLDGLPLRPSTARSLIFGSPKEAATLDPAWALLVSARGEDEARRLLPDWPHWPPCGPRAAAARDHLWRCSVAAATAARSLDGDPDPEASSRLALLLPIGLWALAAVDPDRLADWLDARDPARRGLLERSWFSRDLRGLGLLLAHRWGCDPALVDVLRSVDPTRPAGPSSAAEPDRIARVRAALRLASRTPWALSPPDRPSEPDDPRRRWLIATVQHRTAGGLLPSLDQDDLAPLLREALRLRDRVDRLEEGLADGQDQSPAAVGPALPPEAPGLPSSQVLDAMAEFAGGAAHELNNPLAIIAGRAQLLRSREPDPDRRKDLQTIIDQARRAHQILRDLIYIARPPAPRRVPCLPDQVLRAVVDDLRGEADRRQVGLVFRPGKATGAVLSDPDALRHLADALIRNALEASAPGGLVVVRSIGEARSISWIVRDSGIGLDRERASRMFDPFYCGREAGRGLGLGLPRVARFVRSIGGAIRWRSAPGRGTILRIDLPVETDGERLGDGSRLRDVG
ncbi:ATP-binding protein [Tautonia sociabilis]|uniref:ATP-binding protein n=1 Tax=Tautonia sociabilis TaxID=2080755 RepID=UPI001315A004|nr:ATP-binding protein [Tautonia sociabilis]